MAFAVSPEEAAVLDELKTRGTPNVWASPSESRKQKAISLYLKTRSKSYVCNKIHMGRNTLNSILDDAEIDHRGDFLE